MERGIAKNRGKGMLQKVGYGEKNLGWIRRVRGKLGRGRVKRGCESGV